MSLINDALKQASRTQKIAVAGAAPGHGGANLRPVDGPRSGKATAIVLPILFTLVLTASGCFFWQWWQGRKGGEAFNFSKQVGNLMQSVTSALPGKSNAVSTQVGSAQSQASAGGQPNQSAAGAQAGVKPQQNFIGRMFSKSNHEEMAEGAKPTVKSFPPMKLQGIYYRVGDSTVLINGRNLTIGDEIDGVKIADIDRQSVTLEFQGQTKELRIH